MILNATVRESVHARAKSHASLSGRSLKRYIADAVEEIVERDDAEADRKRREQRRR